MLCNYHTHSTFCDGKESVSSFVEKARKLRFDHLGFSSHAPVPQENNFAIRDELIPDYINEIHFWKKSQSDVKIFVGLECDFIPGVTRDFSFYKQKYSLDYIIGGVHLVKESKSGKLWFIDGSKRDIYDIGIQELYNGDVQKAVSAFWEQTFEMIETQRFDIIAHIDKIKMHNQYRFFTQQENWYENLVLKALDLIKEHNVIVEINSRGLYKKRCDEFYPSDFILKEMAKRDIPCIFSSDAHKSSELLLFYDEALDKLRQNGIFRMLYLDNGFWREYPI
jgi:histidinol-phosphatase (PHP family)